jgi:hypothetical protein
MRRWLITLLLLSPGAAHAASAGVDAMPIASRFDLTRSLLHPVAELDDHALTPRWLAADIALPPGPPHDPPLVRIHGKKVKFRMRF